MNELKRRLMSVLISFNQTLFCLLTLGDSDPDETPSSYAWRSERAGKLQGRIFRPLIDWLFTWVERDHCEQSWLAEKHMYRRPTHG